MIQNHKCNSESYFLPIQITSKVFFSLTLCWCYKVKSATSLLYLTIHVISLNPYLREVGCEDKEWSCTDEQHNFIVLGYAVQDPAE